jgi:hypothetical protein
MKTKFFFLLLLFVGFGLATFAQSQADAPAEKKDAPSAQIVAPDHAKAHAAKADCKFVDTNGDGKCDSCGMTEAECKAKCAPAESKKQGCSSSCPMHKSCGEATAPPKDGKK